MIVSLALGRKGSLGFPGKNTRPINGKPLSWYALNVATKAKFIDRHYLSTDDQKLRDVGRSLGFSLIDRPPELATSEALGEDAFRHGYRHILEETRGHSIEFIVLIFCNACTFTSSMLEEAVRKLRADPLADSAVSVSKYNMFSPIRARRIDDEGYLEPFIDDIFSRPEITANCDRDSQGDVWFADVALTVVRPHCLDNLEEGLLPQRWMGKKILPIHNEAGLDLDYAWQLGQVEWYLENRYED